MHLLLLLLLLMMMHVNQTVQLLIDRQPAHALPWNFPRLVEGLPIKSWIASSWVPMKTECGKPPPRLWLVTNCRSSQLLNHWGTTYSIVDTWSILNIHLSSGFSALCIESHLFHEQEKSRWLLEALLEYLLTIILVQAGFRSLWAQ